MRFKRQQLQTFIHEDPPENKTHPINKYVVVFFFAVALKWDEIIH